MQFLVIAMDGTDDQAMDRRLKARPAHFDMARERHAKGELLMGGAVLDDDGKMIGSSMYVEVESREALDEWLAIDPYVTGDVWRTFDIKEMKLADLSPLEG